jgi:CheY-like chemotaxis protein
MGNLVLVVEHDEDERRRWRRRLENRGYEAVEAGTSVAALELLQRLPDSFRFVLVRPDMPGLPGAAVIEALRLTRPQIPVFCLASPDAVVQAGCPAVTDGEEELELHLQAFANDGDAWSNGSLLPREAVLQIRERYERSRDLVEAAYEVARRLPAV